MNIELLPLLVVGGFAAFVGYKIVKQKKKPAPVPPAPTPAVEIDGVVLGPRAYYVNVNGAPVFVNVIDVYDNTVIFSFDRLYDAEIPRELSIDKFLQKYTRAHAQETNVPLSTRPEWSGTDSSGNKSYTQLPIPDDLPVQTQAPTAQEFLEKVIGAGYANNSVSENSKMQKLEELRARTDNELAGLKTPEAADALRAIMGTPTDLNGNVKVPKPKRGRKPSSKRSNS